MDASGAKDFWELLVALTVIPPGFLAAMTYLLKRLIDHGFARDIETYKHELDVRGSEYKTRFSVLHEKRLLVIGELYERIVKAHQAVASLTNLLQLAGQSTLPEKRTAAADAGNAANDYFYSHRIFLPKPLCAEVDDALNALLDAYNTFQSAGLGDDYQVDSTGNWLKAWDKVKKKFPPLEEKLEGSFRDLLDASDEDRGS